MQNQICDFLTSKLQHENTSRTRRKDGPLPTPGALFRGPADRDSPQDIQTLPRFSPFRPCAFRELERLAAPTRGPAPRSHVQEGRRRDSRADGLAGLFQARGAPSLGEELAALLWRPAARLCGARDLVVAAGPRGSPRGASQPVSLACFSLSPPADCVGRNSAGATGN